MTVKHEQYEDWFAESGSQPTPQAVMNFWLITNNETNMKQDPPPHSLSLLLPPSHPLLLPLPFICSPKERLWHLRMMNSFSALTFLLRTSHPPSCPRPCRWDRDRWRYFALCVHVWVSVVMVGVGVMQWHSEISFGVVGWRATHLQISSQPGRLIQTQEACWREGMTGPEWEERDRQVDRQMGRMGSWQWYTYWECVHICMCVTFRFNIQIAGMQGMWLMQRAFSLHVK